MEKKKLINLFLVAILLIVIGSKLNFIVMMENEGRMPLQWDFYSTKIDDYVLWNDKAQVKYWYLGDIFKIEIIAFSIGDLLMTIGLIMVLTLTMREQLIKGDVKNGN